MATRGACASCGTGLRENAKFCDECGAPTAVLSDAAMYKQVTVLFADVVHSMDLAAVLDAERYREIMSDLVERAAAVVRRYGGTADFTGDGLMGVFGAPVAFEDHAYRGCLAALAVQEEVNRLAGEARRRDGVDLRLRVGLNSGEVIAGEIGSGSLGYAATGEQVGMAQRMESAAPPGGVLLSESTSRLVEHLAVLSEPQRVHIKHRQDPVPARRLIGISPHGPLVGRVEAGLVGRRSEMAALETAIDNAIVGRGGVVNIVGAPGIGKSRMAREAAALAAGRGLEVFWTFCESHATEVPFYAVTRLLRAGTGVADLDADAARARVRERVGEAAAEDLVLLDDLLGIADPGVALPEIDPQARRRRLTALINATSLARTQPALFIIEDAQWVDDVSDSLIADFLQVVSRTAAMVLITSRPEYRGALTKVPAAQAIGLGPLDDSDIAALLKEWLGSDPSIGGRAAIIAERAAGNPFFVEEMVRELAQRGVLWGERGDYVCRTDAVDVAVPATVQAAIEARIDRLSTPAKRALNAASVIGVRFDARLLTALEPDPDFDELLSVQLIEQVRFFPHAEYTFRHPLIRAVAYESQLRSDRAHWHRHLAVAIQASELGSVEENAALIAEHLEAAGDLYAAHGWHMRAGTWLTNRDMDAARLSWERARVIADALPVDAPDRLSMRIAPRTMLCATDYQDRAVQGSPGSQGRFAELRELCIEAGDKVSLAIGMTGQATDLLYAGRTREGSRLASEQMELLESIGDPNLTMALAVIAFCNWTDAGEFGELSRWSQTIIDLAGDDPAKGAGFGVGSPLAVAVAYRGISRWWLGRPGWRQDLDDAVSMARNSTPTTLAAVVTWTCGFAMHYGVLRAGGTALRVVEEAVQAAESCSNDVALGMAEYALAGALLNQRAESGRRRGLELMAHASDMQRDRQIAFQMVPVSELWIARERARHGGRDAAIPVMRKAVNDLYQAGRSFFFVWGSGAFVETLLERGTEHDLLETQEAIDRLARMSTDQGSAICDITLLRLRALLAEARGDNVAHRDLVDRYCTMAKSCGFEGHRAWAAEMERREQSRKPR